MCARVRVSAGPAYRHFDKCIDRYRSKVMDSTGEETKRLCDGRGQKEESESDVDWCLSFVFWNGAVLCECKSLDILFVIECSFFTGKSQVVHSIYRK